jgi:hypothetical protein
MFKRSLVLGGLIAGAFLLPSLAAAAVEGPCVNCHTMHNSQNGAAVFGTTYGDPAKANLLGGSGCAGCHAVATKENLATGRTAAGSATGDGVPQVDYTAGAGYVLNGGYFTHATDATKDTVQHNVVGIAPDESTIPGGTAPGGTMTTQLVCVDCHSKTGHHKNPAGSYRMLPGTNNTSTSGQATKYGPKLIDVAAGATVGTRSEVLYQATRMNEMCATCHPTFHTLANQGDGATWLRHPTDVQVTNSTSFPSIVTLKAAGDIDEVVVGTTTLPAGTVRVTSNNAATDGTVMCISCHVPHGGPYKDMLSYNYSPTDNVAGLGGASTGCETCHSYGTGM